VTLAVIMILTAFAIPSLTRAYNSYLFNSTASQVAGILKLSRFEAIRRNRQVSCQIQQAGTDWLLWADSNGDGLPGATEPQYRITGNVTLLPAGAAGLPDPTPIATSLGASGLTAISGANAAVGFDHRGAVTIGGGQPPVYVLYIGNPASADSGFRAVVLQPSGAVHIWTAGNNGAWQQVS